MQAAVVAFQLCNSLPLSTSHSRSVLSGLNVRICLPSGEKTPAALSVCPSNCLSSLPVSTSHSRTVLSSAQESSRLPSGETAKLGTACGVADELTDDFARGNIPKVDVTHGLLAFRLRCNWRRDICRRA